MLRNYDTKHQNLGIPKNQTIHQSIINNTFSENRRSYATQHFETQNSTALLNVAYVCMPVVGIPCDQKPRIANCASKYCHQCISLAVFDKCPLLMSEIQRDF